MHQPQQSLARLPAIDRLLGLPACAALLERFGWQETRGALRAVVAEQRTALRAGAPALADEAIVARAGARLDEGQRPGLHPVLNLTGTVLHTNLGRAPLPEAAIEAMGMVARGAANLEYRLDSGRRGDRDEHVEADLVRLTGAEAATVVNNNAAAVLLVLNSLALRKEVLISRGELIEIGGAFRMPEIMQRAGVKLREVGTTNRTHARDFSAALTPRAGMIMKVHTSNYRIEGFTAVVPDRRLAEIAQRHALPFVVDLGSGSLVDCAAFGLPREPTARDAVAAGADIVTFSGDKLLGGPQAGIIVGRRDLVATIKANPLKRALRTDKMTIAALAAVLRLYRNPGTLAAELPALRLLTRPQSDIRAAAARLAPRVAAALAGCAEVAVVDCASEVGSGALPVDTIASAGLALTPHRARGASLARLAGAFRALPVPVIGRVRKDTLVFDLRCLLDEEAFARQLPLLQDRLQARLPGQPADGVP